MEKNKRMKKGLGEGVDIPGWVKWGFIGSIIATAGLGALTFILFHMFMA